MKQAQPHTRRRIAVGITTIVALALTSLQGAPATAAQRPTPPAWSKAVPGSEARDVERSGGSLLESASIVSAEIPSGGEYVISTDGSAKSEAVSVPSPDGTQGTVVDGAWRELGWTGIDIASAGDPVTKKETATQLKASKKGAGKAKAKARAAKITAKLLERDHAKRLGLTGPVFELKRSDGTSKSTSVGLRIPKKMLDGVFGADYASRAQWVQVDASKAPTSAKELAAKKAQPVGAGVASGGHDLVIAPMVANTPVMVMARSMPVGGAGTGDFTATSLKPSAAWDVSAQTGTFSWQYALRVPPAPAGPVPDLSLSYDSQSVDGLTGSTNNQPSAIGEGWSLSGTGFIERSYVGCAVDDGPSGPVKTSGDLCWKNANATVSFAGHSGELVQVAGRNEYRLANDDGTRFTELKGAPCAANGTSDTACWQMVTTDGTQYFFGLNRLPNYASGNAETKSAWTVPVYGNDVGEPCHAATFAASSCNLAWRWNLDYVVDVHGNAEAFYYNAQTNMYAKNGTTAASYARGGELERIEYGLTASTVYGTNAASGRVYFSYDKFGRCSDAGGGKCTAQPAAGNAVKPANPSAYPDVPFDQLCTSGTCAGLISPTFWSTSRVSAVKTQVLRGGSYTDVDSWTLKHSFPDPGDATSAALWLNSITHAGHVGESVVTEPTVTFAGTTMQNRVWAIDGLAPLNKWRISSITTELGAMVSVNYSGQQCVPADRAAIFAAPQNNSKRCFPQWWAPSGTPPQPPQQDLFHKYVVAEVIDNPNTGGSGAPAIEKHYVYGSPAWRYNDSPLTPADKRTWSIFAGYDTTEVRVGSASKPAEQNVTKYVFFRGLNGDREAAAGGVKFVSVGGVSDERAFAGRVREQTVLKGVGGEVLSMTTTTPWMSAPTANNGYRSAWYTGDATVVVSEPVSTGGNRTTTTSTVYESAWGLPVTQQVVRSDAPTTCLTTTYAPANLSVYVAGRPAEVLATSGTCDTAGSAGADRLISNVRTSYDGGAVGAAPDKGDPTTVESVTSMSGSTKTWTVVAATVYDALGRPTRVTDALGRVNATAYTPAVAGGPTTKVVSTNAVGWTTSTEVDPAWGAVVKATDENGKVTSASYDPLGRRTGVWLPNRPQEKNASSPSTEFAYALSQAAASAVTTTTLIPGGSKTTIDLFDGLGRVVQGQAPAIQSGGVMTDTAYDSQGRVASVTKPYWSTSSPSAKLFIPTSMAQVPSRTDTVYDAAGRTVASVLYKYGTESFRTTHAYSGADRIDVVPPTGGTPTSTFTDSLGQRSKLVQYPAATISGAGLATTYEYSAAGRLTAMTDPVGNSWRWEYDLAGNQVTADDPDSGRTTSTYDLAGNVMTTTDARGQALAYTYDQLDRKTAKFADSTSGRMLTSWSFDSLAKGKLTSSTSYTGSVPGKPGLAYTSSVDGYTDLYKPTATTVSIPAGAPAFGGTKYTVSLAYLSDGTLNQRTLPAIGGLASEKLKTTFDGLGNEYSLSGATKYANLDYTPTGQLSVVDRGTSGNTLYSTFGYDPATGDRNQVIDTVFLDDGTYKEASRLYTRTASGNVTAIATTGSFGTDTQCFTYDYLSQLREAWTPSSGECGSSPTVAGLGGVAPYWTSYAVDPATGNRLSATSHARSGDTTTAYSYAAAGTARPHAVIAAGKDQYSYDTAGNTLTRPGQTLTWDESGKLSTVTAAGVTQSRVYDADGNVLLQSDPKSGTKLFLGGTELTVAPGASAASGVRTYSIAGVTVAERTSKAGVSGTKVTWLSGDLNGTQDLSVGQSSGEIVRRYADPYGNARGAKAEWSSGHGYLNAPESPVTGLTQLGARAYDSVLGKFLSVDPVLAPENPVQNNGYAYSHNNPVTKSDPSGLAPGLMLADNGGSYGAPRALGSYNTPKPSAPTSSSTGGGGGQRPSGTSNEGPSSGKGPSKAKQRDSVMEAAKWVTNSDLGQTLMMGCGFIPILGSLCAGAEAAVVVGAGAAVGAAKIAAKLATRAAKSAEATTKTGAHIDPGKFDYLFGNVTSNPHNSARSAQNAAQLSRVGVYDDAVGRSLIQQHLDGVVRDETSILRSFSNEHGGFQIRESLFAGPGGFVKFESAWQVTDSGLRLTTVIPRGR